VACCWAPKSLGVGIFGFFLFFPCDSHLFWRLYFCFCGGRNGAHSPCSIPESLLLPARFRKSWMKNEEKKKRKKKEKKKKRKRNKKKKETKGSLALSLL
jgi:hypothetical protein